MASENRLAGHLAAFGAYAIFGLNIVICKDIANCGIISPIALFTLRAAGASALFWIISLFMPKEKVARGDFWKIVAASLIGFLVTQLTFLKGITMTTAIDASILSTLSPVFTMLIAAVALKEPITFKKAGGVAISFTGALFLIFNSVISGNGVAKTSPWGIVLMLLNSLSFASYLGIFRPVIARYSVITFMKWIFLSALICSLPFSVRGLMEADFAGIPANVRWEIVFLIVCATFIAYFLIPIGQKNIRPTLVSMYSYLQPMIAAVVAIAAGLDVITWQKILAAVLVVSGVILVNKSRSRTSATARL